MSYVLTNSEGIPAAQHHGDPTWPEGRRLVQQLVRVLGRDGNTGLLLVCDGPDGNCPNEPQSVGYVADRALWIASGEADPANVTRETPIWGGAFPGVVVNPPSGTTSDPYKSKVVSQTYVRPAFWQNPTNPKTWDPDTGTVAQRVAPAGGTDFPAGTQVIVAPFSVGTQQQMAAFKASSELIAVWKGGAPRGPMGTLVYDVTPDGKLDVIRRARDHSSWRVYRLPETGLMPFGAAPAKTTSGEPPISSGLAWQLGLDVDGQAGYGAVVDLVGPDTPADQPVQESFVGNALNQGEKPQGFNPQTGGAEQAAGFAAGKAIADLGSTQTQEKPTAGQGSPGTVTKPGGTPQTVQKSVVLALTTKNAFGLISVGQPKDKHHIADTPDGEPVNAAHFNVKAPIDGDTFDAPMETAGVYEKDSEGGPLWLPVKFRYDPLRSHPFLGGEREGLRRWQAPGFFDSPPPRQKTGQDKTGNDKAGGFDKSGGTDKTTADKLGGSDKYGSADKSGDGGYKPSQDPSGGDYKPVRDAGTKAIRDATKLVSDGVTGGGPGITDGPRPGNGGDKPVFGDHSGAGTDTPLDPRPVPKAMTFGSFILFGGDPGAAIQDGYEDGQGTILQNRRYARTPSQIAGPGIIGRPVPLDGYDLRGRVDGFTEEQQAAYERATPITGEIAAFGDQSGGSFRFWPGAGPGTGIYVDGAVNAGGFILVPPTVDVRELQRDGSVPPDSPLTGFLAGSLSGYIGVADISKSGLPKSGYTWGRGDYSTCSIDWWDSSSIPGGSVELPPAVYIDSGQASVDPPPSFLVWGGQVVCVWDTTNGQAPAGSVFVADGTNAGPGGTWQAGLSNAGPGVFGDGSDGAATLNGGAAPTGMTFDAAITYTMTRDCYYTNLTMSGAYRLITNGWRLYVSGTLTLAASNRIGFDGNPAVSEVNGAALTPQTVGFGSAGAGGQVRTTVGISAGVAASAIVGGSFGGAGGASGGDFFYAVGAGGGVTAPATNFGELRQTPQITLARLMSYQGDTQLVGGAGGGGGGVDYNAASSGTIRGGGGGGGAGVVMIAAKKLVNAGIISADGGPGGAATATGVTTGSLASGGGGGGGGLVIVVYGSNGSTLGTVQANGGLGGADINAPTIPSTNGSAGRTRILAL